MTTPSRDFWEDTRGLSWLLETLLEILILTVIYYIVWRKGYGHPFYVNMGKYVLMAVYGILLYLLFKSSDCTLFGHAQRIDLVFGQTIALFLGNSITYLQLCLTAHHMLRVGPILLLMALEFLVATGLIFLFDALNHRLYSPHRMLLIYGSEQGMRLKAMMDSRRDKYNISKTMSTEEGFDAICLEILKYDAVILSEIPAELRNAFLKFCYRWHIRTYVAPKLTDILLRCAKENTLFDTPLLLVRGIGLTPFQRAVKRCVDIVFSLAAAVLAAPLMLGIAIAIKLEDGGPVFYKQSRLTQGGQEFEILKFRSMIVDAEKYAGAVLASDNDPRITRVGRVIRTSRLDELPQIFNIIRGDMSIVGPRPERKVIADEYCKRIPEFEYRLKVRGGLTGYAQVYGKYSTTPYDKLRMDLIYIENYSLLLDLKLILLTVRVLFSKDSSEGVRDHAPAVNPQEQSSDNSAAVEVR